MISPEELLRHAATFHQAGRYAEAEELYLAILQAEPKHPDANHNLGLLAMQQGQAKHGLAYLQTAWEAAPSVSQYWLTLGECLLALAQFEDAASVVKEAMKRGMKTPQTQQLRLRAKRGRDRTAPPDVAAGEVLGLFRAGHHAELESRIQPLLKQYPGWQMGWRALGAALTVQKKNAEHALRRAVLLAPHNAEALNNLAVFLRARGRMDEALANLQMALQIRPDYAEGHFNLAAALLDIKHFDEALASLRRALEIRPSYAEAYNCMGRVYKEQHKLEEAMRSFRQALKINPNFTDAQNHLTSALMELGQVSEALAIYRNVLDGAPGNAVAYSNFLFGLTHSSSADMCTLHAEHLGFGKRFEMPPRAGWAEFPNKREPERSLRVGFVSGDLYYHAIANFLEPVLINLARNERISLHAYYNHVLEDNVSQRLKGYFAQWDMVAGMADEELVRKIRADGIDILIDLSGHTGRNRLLTFAHRAAPVQASWIGYAGTTGLQAMDYYLGDRYFLPLGQFDRYFTEKIVRLPANAPFLPAEDAPAVNTLPALDNGSRLTFGSFNRLSKISRPVVALWSRLMHASPGSRMLLGAMPADGNFGNLPAWFEQEGIRRERLDFHPRSDMNAYLALHQRVDICLDTFPYNGGTTTCHAAWMGVPTLTLAGETVTGRVGATILWHAGLEEFVADDEEDFVQKGLYWAANLAALSDTRAGLRERFAKSAMGQPAVVAAGLERALRIMWQRWCMGLPAESFEVSLQDVNQAVQETGT